MCRKTVRSSDFLALWLYAQVEDKWRPGLSGDFKVEVEASGASLAVNSVPRGEAFKVYGKPCLIVGPGEVDLRFVAFFDWDERGPREFKMLEVQITGMLEHPELVGSYALVDLSSCSIWLEYHIAP